MSRQTAIRCSSFGGNSIVFFLILVFLLYLSAGNDPKGNDASKLAPPNAEIVGGGIGLFAKKRAASALGNSSQEPPKAEAPSKNDGLDAMNDSVANRSHFDTGLFSDCKNTEISTHAKKDCGDLLGNPNKSEIPQSISANGDDVEDDLTVATATSFTTARDVDVETRGGVSDSNELASRGVNIEKQSKDITNETEHLEVSNKASTEGDSPELDAAPGRTASGLNGNSKNSMDDAGQVKKSTEEDVSKPSNQGGLLSPRNIRTEHSSHADSNKLSSLEAGTDSFNTNELSDDLLTEHSTQIPPIPNTATNSIEAAQTMARLGVETNGKDFTPLPSKNEVQGKLRNHRVLNSNSGHETAHSVILPLPSKCANEFSVAPNAPRVRNSFLSSIGVEKDPNHVGNSIVTPNHSRPNMAQKSFSVRNGPNVRTSSSSSIEVGKVPSVEGPSDVTPYPSQPRLTENRFAVGRKGNCEKEKFDVPAFRPILKNSMNTANTNAQTTNAEVDKSSDHFCTTAAVVHPNATAITPDAHGRGVRQSNATPSACSIAYPRDLTKNESYNKKAVTPTPHKAAVLAPSLQYDSSPYDRVVPGMCPPPQIEQQPDMQVNERQDPQDRCDLHDPEKLVNEPLRQAFAGSSSRVVFSPSSSSAVESVTPKASNVQTLHPYASSYANATSSTESSRRNEASQNISNRRDSQWNVFTFSDSTCTGDTFDELLAQFMNDIQEGTDFLDKGENDLLKLEVDLSHALAAVLRYKGEMMDLLDDIEGVQAMAEGMLTETAE